MPINIREIEIGSLYITGTDQLRKVVHIKKDENGRKRVHYIAKSALIQNRKFEMSHTLKNPPFDSTFANACSNKLNDNEISDLISKGILNKEELS
jgi:hypothetical protein